MNIQGTTLDIHGTNKFDLTSSSAMYVGASNMSLETSTGPLKLFGFSGTSIATTYGNINISTGYGDIFIFKTNVSSSLTGCTSSITLSDTGMKLMSRAATASTIDTAIVLDDDITYVQQDQLRCKAALTQFQQEYLWEHLVINKHIVAVLITGYMETWIT